MKKVSLIVLKNKDKFLLYLRDDKNNISYPNYWSLIGGMIEKNETPLKAIKREIKEEINCNIEKIKFIGRIKVLNDPMCADHTIFVFKGEINENINNINLTEGQKISYFKLSKLKELKMPNFLKKFIFQNKDKILK